MQLLSWLKERYGDAIKELCIVPCVYSIWCRSRYLVILSTVLDVSHSEKLALRLVGAVGTELCRPNISGNMGKLTILVKFCLGTGQY